MFYTVDQYPCHHVASTMPQLVNEVAESLNLNIFLRKLKDFNHTNIISNIYILLVWEGYK